MAMKHNEILEQFENDWQFDRANRHAGIQDQEFKAGNHWPDRERQAREQDGRPCLTINRIPSFVNRVAGGMRQSRPSIDAFPVDGNEDKGLSQIFDGLIRQIQYRSDAGAAYGHAIEDQITCGIGHWRINTVESIDSPFDLDIEINRIMDPYSVVWDANAVKLDRSDAMHSWITEWTTRAGYKKRFKKDAENATDVPAGYGGYTNSLNWSMETKIRIAEYWERIAEKRTFVQTNQGSVVDITDWSKDSIWKLDQEEGIHAEKKDGKRYKVIRRILDGDDFLDDGQAEWAGIHIPIIPVLGGEVTVNGQTIRTGLIRHAKDPQMLYNVTRSAMAEMLGRAPKDPFLVTLEQIEGLENEWANANRSNKGYLTYKATENGSVPQRSPGAQIPAAYAQEANITNDEMKATTGVFDASLGDGGNETSGRAINARQRQSDTGSFVYVDNFNTAIKRGGQILVDLIPKIYDGERIVRLLGADDKETIATINKRYIDADGQERTANDLSQARFDVRIKTGPDHATGMAEARQMVGEALQGNPNLWQVIGDLYFKNSDYPGADDIADRLRKMVPAKLLSEAEQEALPQQQADPMQDIMAKIEIAKRQVEIMETEAAAGQKEADTKKKLQEAKKLELDNMATVGNAMGHAQNEQFGAF